MGLITNTTRFLYSSLIEHIDASKSSHRHILPMITKTDLGWLQRVNDCGNFLTSLYSDRVLSSVSFFKMKTYNFNRWLILCTTVCLCSAFNSKRKAMERTYCSCFKKIPYFQVLGNEPFKFGSFRSLVECRKHRRRQMEMTDLLLLFIFIYTYHQN